MQIPQCIAKDVVPKMTSLPAAIKPKISTVGSGEISYHDQVIMITFTDDGKTPASATYYIPSWEDILAEDWSCITPADETGTTDNRPVTERIKTFEDACDDLNRRAQAGDKLANDLMTDLQFNSPRTPDLLAYIQLRIITYALNEGWVPQFTEDEYRYYPYFYLYTQKEIDDMSEDDKAQLFVGGGANNGAQCGLSYAISDSGFSGSNANLGARLAFKSSELAKYAGRQFAALWSALVFKPIPEEQK